MTQMIENGGICDESSALVLRETPQAVPSSTLVKPISNQQTGLQVKRKERQRIPPVGTTRGISGEATHQNVQKPMKKKLNDQKNRKVVSMTKSMPVKKAETKTSKISPNKSDKIDRPPISRGLSILFTRQTRSRSTSQGRSSTTPKVNSRRQSISDGTIVPSPHSRLPSKDPEVFVKKAKLRYIPTISQAKTDQKSKDLFVEKAGVSLKSTKKEFKNPESSDQKVKSKESNIMGVSSTGSPTPLLTRQTRPRNPGFGDILNGFLSSKSRPQRKSRDTDTMTDSHELSRRDLKLKRYNSEGSGTKIIGAINHVHQVPGNTATRDPRASQEAGKTKEKEKVAQAARRALGAESEEAWKYSKRDAAEISKNIRKAKKMAAEKDALEKEAAENYQKNRNAKREADQDTRRARKSEKEAADTARRVRRTEREVIEKELEEEELAEASRKTQRTRKEVDKDTRRSRKAEEASEDAAETSRSLQRAEREADKAARRARKAEREAAEEAAEFARRTRRAEREAAEKEMIAKELAETFQKTRRIEKEVNKDSRRARRAEREAAEKEAAEEAAETARRLQRAEREADKAARRARKAEREAAEEAAEFARRTRRADRKSVNGARRTQRSEKRVTKAEAGENEVISGTHRAKGERHKWHQGSENPRPEEQARRTIRRDLKPKENTQQEIFESSNGHAEKHFSHREKSERRREHIGRHKSVSQVPQTDEERRRRREGQSASHTLNEDIILRHSESVISGDENQISEKSLELKPLRDKQSSRQNRSPHLHSKHNLYVQESSDANSSVESSSAEFDTDEPGLIDERENGDSRKSRKPRCDETEEKRAKGRKRRKTKFKNEASKNSFEGLKDEKRPSRRNSTYVSPRTLSPRGGLLSRWRKMAGI
ncbi:hypothetical protein GcM1_218005 [Golovinomyces cichoracearum]|uniref:Uncharacterized protein n=1 Tax=Golovinomyces cichoracearum TaxID=62708 RepID=A0A420ISH6_9PEZI|nr:hypothetical protein GcM1_218005 [Golovinomyces cichoracearum]